MKKVTFLVAIIIFLANYSLAQTLYLPEDSIGLSLNGNVGVGTNTPSEAFQVIGTTAVTHSNEIGLKLQYTGASGGQFQSIGSNSNGDFIFSAHSTIINNEHLLIQQNTGNIGIGTISPSYKLDIESPNFIAARFKRIGSNGGSAINIENGAGTFSWNIAVGTNDYFAINKFGETFGSRLIIKDDGSTGIGTTRPLSKLHVSSGNSTAMILQSTVPDVGLTFQNSTGTKGQVRYDSGTKGFEFRTLGDSIEDTKLFIGDNGKIGIGTTDPQKLLHVKASGWTTATVEAGVSSAATMELANSAQTWQIQTSADNTFVIRDKTNNAKRVLIDSQGHIGIGTTTPDSELTVAGKIHSQEVKVTVDAGADFVFEENYALPQLEETESYVRTNKHLPGIDSEKEMLENGVKLGEMNIKLLQKIEELTLYLIDQNKELQSQKEQNQNQQELIELLQKEVELLKQ